MCPVHARRMAPWFVLMLAVCCLRGVAAASPAFEAVDSTMVVKDGSTVHLTRGTLEVPARHGRNDGPRLRIAFVRIPVNEAPGAAAHVLLAGGPGASGVDGVMSIASRGRAALALFGGDLIGMDQRGTGQSVPNLDWPGTYGLPLEPAGSREAWLPLIRAHSERAAVVLGQRGVDVGAFNTRESADDVEALRAALGYDSLVLWGRSYGSHLALAVLKQHPSRVQRLVLVAPEGPDHTWKRPALVDAVIARVAERAGQPALPRQMAQVLERLRRKPVTLRIRDPRGGEQTSLQIGALDLQLLTLRALGDPRTLATLPAAYQRMANGDFNAIAPWVLEQRRQWGVGSAMKHLTDLAAAPSPRRAELIASEETTSLLGEAVNFPGPGLASAWGVADLGDAFRAPTTSHVPALILVGDLDPRTPIENAREIAQTQPNSRVVVLRNATHEFDLFGSPRLRALMSDFQAGGPLPDTVDVPPIAFQPATRR